MLRASRQFSSVSLGGVGFGLGLAADVDDFAAEAVEFDAMVELEPIVEFPCASTSALWKNNKAVNNLNDQEDAIISRNQARHQVLERIQLCGEPKLAALFCDTGRNSSFWSNM